MVESAGKKAAEWHEIVNLKCMNLCVLLQSVALKYIFVKIHCCCCWVVFFWFFLKGQCALMPAHQIISFCQMLSGSS